MTPARLRWGMLMVTFGLLLLLRNLGTLSDDFWVDLLIYFPIVLILIGIEKIFTKSRLQFISYFTSFLLLVGGIGIAFYSSWNDHEGSFFSQTSHRVDFDPEVKKLSAVLKLGETDLTIRDSGDDLVFGRFDRFTQKPRISYSVEQQEAKLVYTARRGGRLGGAITINTGEDQDWYIQFSDLVPLDLECYGEDSDIHLNLSTTPLRRLKLNADDAHIYLKLGEMEPEVTVVVVGGQSDLKLRMPESVGLRMSDNDYRSYLTKVGLIETEDGIFVTEGIDTLITTVELDLDEHLSSFSVDCF
ncbi:MAG: hypothetical protein KAU35_08270 [candidate division Zixibacteria bacterium]|nr:hypothetical protein [candidate division Zixibacteria bacterium]